MLKNHNYKFSIVTAVYNTEEYVFDAIDSVIKQSIGFEDNVQIILVNDGSTDRSGEICKEYRDRYPNNIVYIEQENRGVSSARNRGLEKVEGKYVNFLDSDDKLSENALEEVWKFFEDHHDEIDFVSIPIHYFEAVRGEHHLNYKFDESHIVNIFDNPDEIILSSSSSFLKESVFNNYKFDESIHYTEDAKLLTYILFQNPNYGVVNTATYFYRKRDADTSAIQNSIQNESWFFDTPKNVYLDLLNKSKDIYGGEIKYVQHLVMCDIQFRLKVETTGILKNNKKKRLEYINLLANILSHIDDEIIMAQKFCSIEHKLYALSLKHQLTLSNLFKSTTSVFGELFYKGEKILSKNDHMLRINKIKINKNQLEIDGLFQTPLPPKYWNLSLNLGKQTILLNPKCVNVRATSILDDTLENSYYFKQKLELDNNNNKGLFTLKIGDMIFRLKIRFIKGQSSQFLCSENKIFLFKTKYFKILKNSFRKRFKLNTLYFLRLLKRKKIKVLIFRLAYLFLKTFKRKEIWIFSDRLNSGGDNGEILFEYATKQMNNSRKYFLINKISPDRSRIKKYGKVLDFNTIRYKLIFLLADKIISSQATNDNLNPFGKHRRYYYDLYNFDFIFLQHGVMSHDLSWWLNKPAKNIDLFITSTKPEHESILNYEYLYEPEEVVLTGLPRFDRLQNNTENEILIMPTWRSNLALPRNEYGLREKNPAFKESDYYYFYNSLINNTKLVENLKELGYKVVLHLHPEFIQYAEDFDENSESRVDREVCNYSKAFSKGCLLVTDYSSTVFDFAYLRKPVIYSQFDRETFYQNHNFTQTYLDFERDGFGPVCYDLENTVNTIIEMLKNRCKLGEKYKNRIEETFKYDDRNNSKRVYEAIRELDR